MNELETVAINATLYPLPGIHRNQLSGNMFLVYLQELPAESFTQAVLLMYIECTDLYQNCSDNTLPSQVKRIILLYKIATCIGNNVSWFVHLQETWLGNNVFWFVHLQEIWLGNNVSWFVHLQETWLGNNVSWFVRLQETWLGNNVSWFVHLQEAWLGNNVS
jgi:hypothetical protein